MDWRRAVQRHLKLPRFRGTQMDVKLRARLFLEQHKTFRQRRNQAGDVMFYTR